MTYAKYTLTLCAILFSGITLSAQAEEKAKVTYAGQGRYTCSGSSAECAQIDFNNRSVSQSQTMRYQQEQDRASAYVEREREKEEQRRIAQKRP
jgi:signal transduction histidine kinase